MDVASATLIIQILGISALLAIPRTLYASIFNGLQRMEFNNIIDVITNFLQQMGIVVILFFDGGLMAVIYWMASSFGLSILLYLVAVRSFFPWHSFLPRYNSAVVKKTLDTPPI